MASNNGRGDEGGCCGCVGCLVVLAVLMALAGNWWAWVPLVIAGILYNLLYVKDGNTQRSDKGDREWWRLDYRTCNGGVRDVVCEYIHS